MKGSSIAPEKIFPSDNMLHENGQDHSESHFQQQRIECEDQRFQHRLHENPPVSSPAKFCKPTK